jgi:hypothetical protein
MSYGARNCLSFYSLIRLISTTDLYTLLPFPAILFVDSEYCLHSSFTYNFVRGHRFNKRVFDSMIVHERKEDLLSLIGQSFLGNTT